MMKTRRYSRLKAGVDSDLNHNSPANPFFWAAVILLNTSWRGSYESVPDFALLRFIRQKNLDLSIARRMLPQVYQYPKMEFDSVLTSMNFKTVSRDQIVSKIPFLRQKFAEIQLSKGPGVEHNWIMGQLRRQAEGNMNMKELHEAVG